MTEKHCYLLWSVDDDRSRCRDLLVHDLGPRLLALSPDRLVAYVVDPESKVRTPTPFRPRNPPPATGLVDLWLPEGASREPYERILRAARFELAGYLVEESVYRDYGGNRHAAPRSWPDGARSPGIAQLTLLERPARFDREEWIRRWHGTISPVSEAIQPRSRYVRNAVLRAVTPDAPDLGGIVVECWPSARHVTNPFLFYGAKTPFGLALNLFRILRAVTSFLDLRRIRTTMAGEYFLATGFRP
jgi:hypothetical protein